MNPVCDARIPVQLCAARLCSAHLFVSSNVSQKPGAAVDVIASLCNVLLSSLSHYCLTESSRHHNIYVYINFEFGNALKHKIVGLKTHLGVPVRTYYIVTEKDFISRTNNHF